MRHPAQHQRSSMSTAACARVDMQQAVPLRAVHARHCWPGSACREKPQRMK